VPPDCVPFPPPSRGAGPRSCPGPQRPAAAGMAPTSTGPPLPFPNLFAASAVAACTAEVRAGAGATSHVRPAAAAPRRARRAPPRPALPRRGARRGSPAAAPRAVTAVQRRSGTHAPLRPRPPGAHAAAGHRQSAAAAAGRWRQVQVSAARAPLHRGCRRSRGCAARAGCELRRRGAQRARLRRRPRHGVQRAPRRRKPSAAVPTHAPFSRARGLLGTCATIAREEGASALWKGLEPGEALQGLRNGRQRRRRAQAGVGQDWGGRPAAQGGRRPFPCAQPPLPPPRPEPRALRPAPASRVRRPAHRPV
jgi:hypothetical protein